MKTSPSPSIFSTFRNAARGIAVTFRTERSFRIQLSATVIAIAMGRWFGISRSEWLVLIAVILLVLVLELLNSAMERVVDIVKPRLDDTAREIKDITASAVLLASCAALIFGAFIFLPPILRLFAV